MHVTLTMYTREQLESLLRHLTDNYGDILAAEMRAQGILVQDRDDPGLCFGVGCAETWGAFSRPSGYPWWVLPAGKPFFDRIRERTLALAGFEIEDLRREALAIVEEEGV